MKTAALASVLSLTVTSAAARALPPDIIALSDRLARIELTKACVPKTAAFLDRYLAAHATESGTFFLVPLSDKVGTVEYHAVALFTFGQRRWIYDHELGVLPSDLPVENLDLKAAQPVVAHILRSELPRAQAAYTRQQELCGGPSGRDVRAQALASAEMLGFPLRAAVIRLSPGGGEATAWDFMDQVWVYAPGRGTSWARPDGVKRYRTLVSEALAKLGLKPSFEIFPVTADKPPAA
ncbi:MAG TPA: hypothetical protein VHD32_16505 [Candidatus Didemnitutus sp.]|nr:hypothetical protein [Candidatus Didemnitutus sp.]